MMLSISQKYRDKNILLTGSTGFLAKSVLEKILRAIPGVGGIYLLIRPRADVTASQRMEWEVLTSSIFQLYRRQPGSSFYRDCKEKLVPVSGDISRDRLGLTDPEYRRLTKKIDLVINCAAACSFRERLDRALHVNTLGPSRVLQFARDCGNAPLVHVSTCYVNGIRDGDIPEEVLPPGETPHSIVHRTQADFDIDVELSAMLARCGKIRSSTLKGHRDHELLDDPDEVAVTEERMERLRTDLANKAVVEYGLMMAQRHGWTDVYPFSKALGEQLLVRDAGQVPLAIVRPSIIESSHDEPVPGWIDGLRMSDPLITEVGRGNLKEFAGSGDTCLDLIPCDMVSNAIIAAMPAPGDRGRSVYQVSSSSDNPLTLAEMGEAVHEAFVRRPAHDSSGRRMEPSMIKFLPTEVFFRKIYVRKRRLKLLNRFWSFLGAERRARWAKLQIRLLSRFGRFAELYGFYASSSPRFDDTNTKSLLQSLHEDDRETFAFDITCVDWRDYLIERHVPGLQRAEGGGSNAVNVVAGSDTLTPKTRTTDDERRQVSA